MERSLTYFASMEPSFKAGNQLGDTRWVSHRVEEKLFWEEGSEEVFNREVGALAARHLLSRGG